MKRIVLFISMAAVLHTACAQPMPTVIPQPQQWQLLPGRFILQSSTPIVVSNMGMEHETILFNTCLQHITGYRLTPAMQSSPDKPSIHLKLLTNHPPSADTSGYSLTVTPEGITISAHHYTGIFYGLNNLLFMLQPGSHAGTYHIPACTITDAPRFAYRGMMLDVSRHFRSKTAIKKILDQMALLKLNTFHWHLTDDQGWRIEIKKYPKLTETGAWRNGTITGSYPGTGNDNTRHGGFYTQEDVQEIVAYAAARHITVIPEIEMPGHSSAAIAAYPWLSCFPEANTVIPKHPSEISKTTSGKKVQETFGVFEDVFAPTEQTFAFLQDVIDEVVALFPGKYIHVGGDECPKEAWKRSTFCQELIKAKGLKDEHGLQSYFIQRMEKYIHAKGKQLIGWDEILEGGLAPNAIVMSWRGEQGGIDAAKMQHQVIMTPTSHCYLDYSQTRNEDSVVIGGYLPLEKVYSYDPMPEALRNTPYAAYVLGAQGNVWTEYMRSDAKLNYMIFPRLAALSEAIWTQPAQKNWDHFQEKLPAYLSILECTGTNYSKAFFELQAAIPANPGFDGVTWQLKTHEKQAAIWISTPGSTVPQLYTQPVPIDTSGNYTAFVQKNGVRGKPLHQTFVQHKATGRKLTLNVMPSTRYPGNGGIQGLVNGAISQSGLQSTEWAGWQGDPMEAIIDLGKQVPLQTVRVHFAAARGSWIYAPASMQVAYAHDGVTFHAAGAYTVPAPLETMEADFITVPLAAQNGKKIAARYIKVMVQNIGTIPAGYPGAGHKAWLFIDEILVD